MVNDEPTDSRDPADYAIRAAGLFAGSMEATDSTISFEVDRFGGRRYTLIDPVTGEEFHDYYLPEPRRVCDNTLAYAGMEWAREDARRIRRLKPKTRARRSQRSRDRRGRR